MFAGLFLVMKKTQWPRIVVVSHLCPFPSVHGNRTRLVGLLEWLRHKQFAVTFVLQPVEVEDPRGLGQLARLVDRLEIVQPHGPVSRMLAQMKQTAGSIARAVLPGRLDARLRKTTRGVRWVQWQARRNETTETDRNNGHIDDWCWPTTCAVVRHAVARDKPIAVVAEYALFSKCLEGLPHDVLKVIDTVEVFLRNADRFQVEGLEVPLVCTPASEKAALGRADVLVAIQRNDARVLQELFPRTKVITVSHSHRQPPRRPSGPAAGTILYVGSSNPYNVHGLRQFLQHAWPSIATLVPQATLRIVGSVPALHPVEETRIVRLGRVTDEQLVQEYQRANVVINPQVAGTGLKIKCVEALSAGCPLVTNEAGADGLEEGASAAFLLAKDWSEFAKHVTSILTDDTLRRELEAGARSFADKMFTAEVTFSELAQVLTLARHRSGAEVAK